MNAQRRRDGMTLVEALIAMVVLMVVFLITSSGIIQAIQVQQVQEDATSSQSKLRRVVEVMTQEIRGAVLGGVTDFPVQASGTSVSFALLAGDGGVEVVDRPGYSWGAANNSFVYASDASAVQRFVGQPAIMFNSSGALIIPEITGAPAGDRVNHNGCKITIPYQPDTRLISVNALGMRYDADSDTLFQVMPDLDAGGFTETPFAFNLTRFEIAYEYESGSDVVTRAEPYRDASGPLSLYEAADGTEYQLSRLQLTVATEASADKGEREYVSYVEMTGLGNDQRISLDGLSMCDNVVIGDPGGGDDGDGDGDGGDGDGDDGDGDDGDDDGGDDDDDDDDEPPGKW